jgi:lipocalin
MKRSTFFTLASGAVAVAIGGAFAYARATRPPVINPKVPEPAKPVDLPRYLGKWYELARHETVFEKGLDAATAEYTLRPDGKIGIVNCGTRGWPDGEESCVEGRAIVVDETTKPSSRFRSSGLFTSATIGSSTMPRITAGRSLARRVAATYGYFRAPLGLLPRSSRR